MDRVTMPQLGETVVEGTILQWFKAEGDPIGKDEPLFEVSTDKVDAEVPSAFGGFVRRIVVPEGETVPSGRRRTHHHRPRRPGDRRPPSPLSAVSRPEPVADRTQGQIGLPVQGGPQPVVRHCSTARARPGHRQRQRARRSHHPPTCCAPAATDDRGATARRSRRRRRWPPRSRGPMTRWCRSGRARATAEHMTRSRATAATLVAVDVDYARSTGPLGGGPVYLPFVARAVLDGLRQFPHLNASVGDDCLIVHPDVHLGLAVDVGGEALMVPVVRSAADRRITALSDAFVDVAARARASRLTTDELTGATFTITNVGSYGTVLTAPIINMPQVAILSTDGVEPRPVATKGPDGEWAVTVHPVGNLSLSFDHRAVDGAYAAAFLAAVRTTLETRDWSDEL
jgi:2-oxoglutarate dehydrogenase E2 component (dihydrolipoamide succinyltransferase)